MAKLLVRIAKEIEKQGVKITPPVMDDAQRALEEFWSIHGGSLSEKELMKIVFEVSSKPNVEKRSFSALEAPRKAQSFEAATSKVEELPKNDSRTDSSVGEEVTPQNLRNLLMSTTRKQRQMMAESDWIQAAEQDRRDGIEKKKLEKLDHLKAVGTQKTVLDMQLREHERRKEEERLERLRIQNEVSEGIRHHQELTRKEREDAHLKSTKEKMFRELQQRQTDQLREAQRLEELREQARQTELAQQELILAKENERKKKLQEKAEWEKVLEDNRKKLDEKRYLKEVQKESDRQFQRDANAQMEKQERERAEAKAKKEARSAVFESLATVVAKQMMGKQQDFSSKIEAEFQEQLRRSVEDEQNRKCRLKSMNRETQEVLNSQIAEKKRRDEEAREQDRRLAEELKEQARISFEKDECRRLAAKAEAQRMKDFLSTQLQLQHFRETKPLETSITRPLSRAKTMLSPSRYTPSHMGL